MAETKSGDTLKIAGKSVVADDEGKFVVLLDIQNNSDREVDFIANHIRIPYGGGK
jgi:hypothetical protein